jgi:Uma2 family endonuclease
MVIVSPRRVYMPEDLIDPEDGRRFELVDDELVERNVSFESSRIASNVNSFLWSHVRRNRLGEMLESEMGIRLWPEQPSRTRRPDVAFIAQSRVPEGDPGFLYIAPDLVVEVVSRGDSADDVIAKAYEWLRGGVQLVWLVYPAARDVHVYRSDGRPEIFRADDTLTGEDVVPGFAITVSAFFKSSQDA